MKQYFSTFIPGLGEVVSVNLAKKLKNFKQLQLLEGLIVYETDSPAAEIKNLHFLNNSFLLTKPDEKIDLIIGKSFRVVFSKENELIAINKEKLAKIENKIAKINNLVVDRANPDFEFWFLERSEGDKFTGVRITKHPDYKTVLSKGQLRPELANILCLLSNPQKSDVVLDPFAGSGAIGMARKNYLYTKIISEDIKTGFDATNMVKISSQRIDKIITDPPWGISVGKDLDLDDFYSRMLNEFWRVLKPGGVLVILIGNKELFEKILKKFVVLKKYNILVSGKKAAIYVLKRIL